MKGCGHRNHRLATPAANVVHVHRSQKVRLVILRQTFVRSCHTHSQQALSLSELAALDDRPRPGREPTITIEAKAWLVDLACRKAKDCGYPHELWTTRLLASHVATSAMNRFCIWRSSSLSRVAATQRPPAEVRIQRDLGWVSVRANAYRGLGSPPGHTSIHRADQLSLQIQRFWSWSPILYWAPNVFKR